MRVGQELRWDFQRWCRDQLAFVSSGVVSPTAATPGVFLFTGGSTNAANIISIRAAATAAISYQIQGNGTQPPGLTTFAKHSLDFGINTADCSFFGGVVANPANPVGFGDGILPANGTIELVAPATWRVVQTKFWVLVTGLVACNVSLTVMWTEDRG